MHHQPLEKAAGGLSIGAEVWETDPNAMGAMQLPPSELRAGQVVDVQLSLGVDWSEATVGEDGKTILYDSRATKVYGLRASQEAHDLLRVVPGCEYPLCPKSGDPARPNILMFMDGAFSSARANSQEEAYDAWVATLPADASVVVLEVGVGTVVPKIRAKAEVVAQSYDRSTLIRINLDDLDNVLENTDQLEDA
jgi:hypothetical protein